MKIKAETVITILVIIVLIILGYAFFHDKPQAPITPAATPPTASETMSDKFKRICDSNPEACVKG